MGIFSGLSPAKEGKGIQKDNSQKNRFTLFFEIFFRHFWKITELNVLYVIFCIPIITIGPATAGVTKVIRNISLERPAYVWGDFWDSFKKNFKQSFFLGLADILIISGIITGCWLYPKIASETGSNMWYILLSITISAGFIFIAMNFYAYIMIVSTDIPMGSIIRNSFFLTFIALKENLLTFLIFAAVCVAWVVLAIYYQIFLMLSLFLPATILGFIICFRCYPIVQKYVINPFYEQKGEINPELEYNKPATAEESVFADNSDVSPQKNNNSNEKQVKIRKSRKNKTIS